MTRRLPPRRHLRFDAIAIALLLASGALAGCATSGGSAGTVVYGESFWYDDPWYWGGCCVDPPGDIGPPGPRPEHPIAKPPPVGPSQPIANPPDARPSQPIAARPAPMPRAGGRGGRR
jgi:hypothetical protein